MSIYNQWYLCTKIEGEGERLIYYWSAVYFYLMAAAIDEGVGRVRRPELLNKIDTEVNVNDAILLANEEGLLTGLDDR